MKSLNKLAPLRDILLSGKHQLISRAEKNRLKILFFCLLALVLYNKEISFQVNLKKASKTGVVDKPKEDSGLAQKVSIPKTKQTPQKQKQTFETSAYMNLAFVLNPDLADRKKVAPEVVQAHNKKVYDYLNRFGPIAVKEMKTYGVPASITLAQGLLESNVGESRLATKANNHFGIKCFSKKCKKGHCINATDDSHKDFFKSYDSAWESYRNHSEFLQKNRYKHLKKLGTSDYKAWAHGLREAGYATDKRYANKLIKIIEALELHRLDAAA